MPYDPPPELATLSLTQIADLAAARMLPPVDQWHPVNTGDSEMQITADGRWFHQGGEIKRPAMIRAFSSLLRHDDDGRFWLVTPAEKLTIQVDDAPFIAVEMQSEGEIKSRNLAFRLNTDDLIVAGPEHPITFGNIPYLHVRGGLCARISRPVYYELAEIALAEAPDAPGIWSGGRFFAMETPA